MMNDGRCTRRSGGVWIVLGLAPLIGAWSGVAVGGPAAAAAGAATCTWQTMPFPAAPSGLRRSPSGISASSRNNAWTVGSDRNDDPSEPRSSAFAARLVGNTWRLTRLPALGSTNSVLGDVTAISPTDAWAVGTAWNPDPIRETPIALHWNGTSWARTPVPRPNGELGSVSASREGGSVWALGFSFKPSGARRPLLLRWDGTAWTDVTPTSLTTASAAYLADVAALAANNVWVVGSREDHGDFVPFVMHWDGSSWTTLRGSQASGFYTGVGGGAGRNAVWAVGYTVEHAQPVDFDYPFIDKVQRTRTTLSAAPGDGELVAVGGNGHIAWTVGNSFSSFEERSYPVALEWNGASWNGVVLPDAAANGNAPALYDVAAVPRSSAAFIAGIQADPVTSLDAAWILRRRC
jgi:hypothetical protein